MNFPVVFKTRASQAPTAHSISVDPVAVEKLREHSGNGPAVIIAREAAMVVGMKAGMVDPNDIISVTPGDWSNAILILLGDAEESAISEHQAVGDAAFISQVEQNAPDLKKLALDTLAAIRKAGVDGELVEVGGGRWVNRPLNTFTLKAQPRAGNLHFTLYGNPQTYDADGFLLQDQNSYSRGWVKESKDVAQLAELAQLSHARRRR